MSPYCDSSTRAAVTPAPTPALPVLDAPTTRRVPDRSAVVGSGSALLALFLIGTTAPVTASALNVPVLVGHALRYLVAAVIMTILLRFVFRIRLRPAARDLLRIALLGTIGVAGFTFCYASATRYADPALVGSVVAATPVLLALIGPLQKGRRPAVAVVLGATIVAGGTALTTGAGSTGALGLALALGALGCELAFTLFAVRLIDRYGTVATTFYAVTAGSIVLLAAGLIVDGPGAFDLRAAPPTDLISLLYLALAVSIGANLAWYSALPRIGADRAGLFYAFVPVGALTGGLILGTSAPRPAELFGLAIMITGLIIGATASSGSKYWRSRVSRRRPQTG